MIISLWQPVVSMLLKPFTQSPVKSGIRRRYRGQPIDITIVKTEQGGDQHGIMNFDIGGAGLFGIGDGYGSYVPAVLLYQGRDPKQGLHLIAYTGGLYILFYGFRSVVLAQQGIC